MWIIFSSIFYKLLRFTATLIIVHHTVSFILIWKSFKSFTFKRFGIVFRAIETIVYAVYVGMITKLYSNIIVIQLLHILVQNIDPSVYIYLIVWKKLIHWEISSKYFLKLYKEGKYENFGSAYLVLNLSSFFQILYVRSCSCRA